MPTRRRYLHYQPKGIAYAAYAYRLRAAVALLVAAGQPRSIPFSARGVLLFTEAALTMMVAVPPLTEAMLLKMAAVLTTMADELPVAGPKR
eukprot:1978532-Rhodomonas_salina.3